MTVTNKIIKRVFDLFFAIIGLVVLGWFILLIAIISKIYLKNNGFFKQQRIGQYGNMFTIYKIETIHPKEVKKDIPVVTRFGQFLRNSKIDEFPQLLNVLNGEMSFVGPRPDISGFANELKGDDRIILSVKPGITGPASIYFRNEEILLRHIKNPNEYNNKVIWPKKIELNKSYIKQYSFSKDLYYILRTIF